MDEITLFTALRPAQPEDAGELLEAARGRLTCAPGGPAGQSVPPGRRRRARPPRRTVLLAACATVVAACAAIVVPAVLPGRDAGSLVTAAWAVQHNPDGTLKVTFRQARDAAGLQRALRADGVLAYVRYVPWVATGANHYRPAAICRQTGPGNLPGGPLNVMILKEVFPFLAAGGAPAGDALTIRPAAIPKGDAILIEVTWFPGQGGFGTNVGNEVLGNSNPPTCTPTR